jgi:hypothetical protein
VLLLKHGVQAATATEHVVVIVATDIKALKADTTILEQSQQLPVVNTLFVPLEYFLVVALNAWDVKDVTVSLLDLILVTFARSADKKVLQTLTGRTHYIRAILAACLLQTTAETSEWEITAERGMVIGYAIAFTNNSAQPAHLS